MRKLILLASLMALTPLLFSLFSCGGSSRPVLVEDPHASPEAPAVQPAETPEGTKPPDEVPEDQPGDEETETPAETPDEPAPVDEEPAPLPEPEPGPVTEPPPAVDRPPDPARLSITRVEVHMTSIDVFTVNPEGKEVVVAATYPDIFPGMGRVEQEPWEGWNGYPVETDESWSGFSLPYAQLGKPGDHFEFKIEALDDAGVQDSVTIDVQVPYILMQYSYDPDTQVLRAYARQNYLEPFSFDVSAENGILFDSPYMPDDPAYEITKEYRLRFERRIRTEGTVQLTAGSGGWATHDWARQEASIPVHLPTIIASAEYIWPAPDLLVVIDNSRYDPRHGGSVELSCELPKELGELPVQKIAHGQGAVSFTLPQTGAAYDVTLRAVDELGHVDEIVRRVGTADYGMPVGSLIAYPLQQEAAAGEPVRIVVASGLTPEPFQYLTGCRVMVDSASGCGYVPDSFNLGAPGGASYDADGLWPEISDEFLAVPDSFILEDGNGGGRTAIDFTIVPLGGTDAFVEGELFSFEASFTTPGQWRLEFEDVNVVSRTYYQDGNQYPSHFWNDTGNNHAGVVNSILIH